MKRLPIRIRLTAWYLAVVSLTFLLLAIGMYFGVRGAIQRSVDRDLRIRVEEMRQFLLRHRALSEAEMPDEFRKSSGVHPGEDLYQLTDASGAWLYQAPSMAALGIPREIPDSNRPPFFETISRRYSNIKVLSSTVEVSGQHYLVQVATVVSPLYDVLAGFRLIALWTFPLVLIAAGGGGYWLSGRAMRPVHDIARAAQGISERNLSQRLNVPEADDELRHLSETLNSMLARLDAAFKRITRFTADASHELRTPIAVIRTTSEVILERPRPVAEYEEMVGQILSESVYTSDLIESLLTLARTDANPAQLELSLVDARQITEEVIPVGEALAARAGLTISTLIHQTPVFVMAEKQSLKRLLLILLDNAVKYTPSGGEIRLSLTTGGKLAAFEVVNSGIGIAEADLAHIFERFYRGSNARDADVGGSGLGLAIAKWIAEAHQGSLEVRSETSKGTTFRLTLALKAN